MAVRQRGPDAMTCPHHPAVDTSHESCPECGWDEVRDRAFTAVADPNADTVVDEPDACFPHPDVGGTR